MSEAFKIALLVEGALVLAIFIYAVALVSR